MSTLVLLLAAQAAPGAIPPPIVELKLLAPSKVDDSAADAPVPKDANRAVPYFLNPGNVVGQDDYPTSALATRKEGRVSVRMTVSPDGRVTRCVIVGSAHDPALDSTTCRLLTERARFAPALGKDGKPVEANFHQSITWKLPPPAAWRDMIGRTIFAIGPNNSVGACRIESETPLPPEATPDQLCAKTKPLAEDVLRTEPSVFDRSGQELVIERGQVTGGAGALPAGTGPGEVAVSRWAVEVERGPEGRQVACRPAAWSGIGGDMLKQVCAMPVATNVPPPGARAIMPAKVSLYEAIFFRMPRG